MADYSKKSVSQLKVFISNLQYKMQLSKAAIKDHENKLTELFATSELANRALAEKEAADDRHHHHQCAVRTPIELNIYGRPINEVRDFSRNAFGGFGPNAFGQPTLVQYPTAPSFAFGQSPLMLKMNQ